MPTCWKNYHQIITGVAYGLQDDPTGAIEFVDRYYRYKYVATWIIH